MTFSLSPDEIKKFLTNCGRAPGQGIENIAATGGLGLWRTLYVKPKSSNKLSWTVIRCEVFSHEIKM